MNELRDRIKDTIEQEPVVAFVKGTHGDNPRYLCRDPDNPATHANRGWTLLRPQVRLLPAPLRNHRC